MSRTDAISRLSDLLGGHHDVAVRLADALRTEHGTWEEVMKAALMMDDGAFFELASALTRDAGLLDVSGAR